MSAQSPIGSNVLNASTYSTSDPTARRAHAVAAALEVIAARAPAMENAGHLEHEMQKLSLYADLIQSALEGKK